MTAAGTLTFEELLAGTTILRAGGDSAMMTTRVQPRQLADGTFFFKLRSSQFRSSAAEAIRRGAKFVVLEAGDDEEATLPPHVSCAVVDHVNAAYARTCSRVFGDGHRELTLIGVTGAKAKTTVCHLLDAARTSRRSRAPSIGRASRCASTDATFARR